MPVEIRGKSYKTVAERIEEFKQKYGDDLSIENEVMNAAEIVQVKSVIKDKEGRVLATGFAEEIRGSTNINKTSALENCETSAVGRALAFFGFGGSEIASANEVSDAIVQQAKMEVADFFKAHNTKVAEHLQTILVVKDEIANGNLSAAAEAWFELSEEDQRTLWVAPTKGGIFTTEEREVIKSTEFKQAHFGSAA